MKQRKSLRDTLLENQKAERAWASMYGVPVREDLVPVAEKRKHTKKMDDADTEAAVMREITALLAVHPKVLFAWRQNSGMSYNEGGAPVFFYRWVRSRVKMRIPDFVGMLTDGRMLALEAKHRFWKSPMGTREGEQQAFLMTVRNAGGVSGFVTSAAEAQKVIEG